MSRHNIYPGYWFSKFSWSTLCCIHNSSYMLHHLGKPIQIWCWCTLPTQYELILIVVRSKVFDGKGWRSWSLTSKFLILRNNTTLFIFCIQVRLIFTLNTSLFPYIRYTQRSAFLFFFCQELKFGFICNLFPSLLLPSDALDGHFV